MNAIMPEYLRLELTDYIDTMHWRWVLSDDRGNFLADHNVRLNPSSHEYAGFLDLGRYLNYNQPIISPERQLADLGKWIGEQVFGGLRDAFWEHRRLPAVAVQVVIPQTAPELLARPFELACFADGRRFWKAGVRFVYQLEETPAGTGSKDPADKALRVLAVFSLPTFANPLNLRRERYGLQRLVRELNQTRNLAVELRVLQYGATQAILREALEEGESWDIIHLSGHGFQGELLLEDDLGESDTIDANELGDLLDLARARLKLLILDVCNSGASSQAAAHAQLETNQTVLPSLAQTLARRLDCAALAMRYPVDDTFASELMISLYSKLLDKRQPLPAALNLALADALSTSLPQLPLASITPVLFGPRAAIGDLGLRPPRPGLRTVGLGDIPREPERFVGRLEPMLHASQALAPRSAKRGVFFYGMSGAGKTTCALELAHRHDVHRFDGYVWYRAPETGSNIKDTFLNALLAIERQVDEPTLKLTTVLDDPKRLRRALRDLLQRRPLLLLFDHLETLLTTSNDWRDKRWADLIEALLEHDGYSRAVLTARRLPKNLANEPRLQVELIDVLNENEDVLLARELPNLRRLFDDESGQELLRRTLLVAQRNPMLLELADSWAANRDALSIRVTAATEAQARGADVLDALRA